MLIALWALTHRYKGFSRDGELYAVQALSKIHPWLATDLYLQNVSQDRFTVFSWIYAGSMWLLGLQPGEMLLYLVCTAWFLAAAWALARALFDASAAWLSVALLIVTVGYYGAYLIFNYSENYLSARTMGEAMVVTALACHFSGWRRTAWAVAVGGLLIHPLMVLPGVLLLLCLGVPTRTAVIGAVACIIAALAVALAGSLSDGRLPLLTLMDPAWLEVVRERSQFLFLRYWTSIDWEVAARPFVCLTLSALVVRDPQIRRLCIAAMLVGAAGLVITLIAGTLGPVAILVQGQAWRWMWVTGFVSVVLIVPTVMQVWRDERTGPLCAVLMLLSWTFGAVDGLAAADAALALWLVRSQIGERTGQFVRVAGGLVVIVILVWVVMNCWGFLNASVPETGRESLAVGRLREMFGLGGAPVFLVIPCWYWLEKAASPLAALSLAAVLFAAALTVLPGSLKQLEAVGTPAEIADFSDWRAAIPPTSTVLLVPTTKFASFMWFSLGRPSYLTVDQSSGVVFSPTTAQEVRRRSAVLAPLGPPDWKILTAIKAAEHDREAGLPPKPAPKPRALTAGILVQICGDPQLGFVVAQEDLGFQPMVHRHVGDKKDWKLYDCRKVRSETGAPAAGSPAAGAPAAGSPAA